MLPASPSDVVAGFLHAQDVVDAHLVLVLLSLFPAQDLALVVGDHPGSVPLVVDLVALLLDVVSKQHFFHGFARLGFGRTQGEQPLGLLDLDLLEHEVPGHLGIEVVVESLDEVALAKPMLTESLVFSR